MALVYKRGSVLPEEAVKALYEDAGWSVYTQDMPGLMEALANSMAVFTAWDGPQLVGLIRIVGDGKTIFYIQDILVLVSHKRTGIGTSLLRTAVAAYQNVRQKVLLTDDTPETRGFYEANGFRSCDKGDIVAFARFD